MRIDKISFESNNSPNLGVGMDLKSINNQAFCGKYIVIEPLLGSNVSHINNYIARAKKSHFPNNIKISREPFDIYIRETNRKNISMSINANGESACVLKYNSYGYKNFEDACLQIINRAHQEINNGSVWDRLLYALRLKKLNSINWK